MVFLRKPLRQQCIVNGARERNVHDTSGVHVPNLRLAQAKFPSTETVRVGGNVRPATHLSFKTLYESHRSSLSILFFSMTETCDSIRRQFVGRNVDRTAEPVTLVLENEPAFGASRANAEIKC
jgi:hypothetical protein